jgi:DNA-binding beta-propeller fold protein YncE
VYVADTVNNRIQVFSNNGTFIAEWGRYGTGNGSLSSPRGIALDQTGNVYVADTGNNRIQVFSNNGTFISVLGIDGGANGILRSPEGIAVDSSSGNVYVADTGNNRISVFSSRSPIGSEAFLSEEGEIFGNGTTDQIILPGIF